MTASRHIYRKRGTGGFQGTGHFRVTTSPGKRQLLHVVKAEEALGKPLPAGVSLSPGLPLTWCTCAPAGKGEIDRNLGTRRLFESVVERVLSPPAT